MAIQYLREENRVLREQLGSRRIRFTDKQRIRLAVSAKGIPRNALADIATLVTPHTLLNWHRKLIAKKYDGVVSVHPADLGFRMTFVILSCDWREKTVVGATLGFEEL
jgi:hypothetical protein